MNGDVQFFIFSRWRGPHTLCYSFNCRHCKPRRSNARTIYKDCMLLALADLRDDLSHYGQCPIAGDSSVLLQCSIMGGVLMPG